MRKHARAAVAANAFPRERPLCLSSGTTATLAGRGTTGVFASNFSF
jgi:hypothetical protein